jgi:hypothetical protein
MYLISTLSTKDLAGPIASKIDRYTQKWNVQYNNVKTYAEVEATYSDEIAKELSARKKRSELNGCVRDLKRKLFDEYWLQFIQSGNPDAKLDFEKVGGERSIRFPKAKELEIKLALVNRNELLEEGSSIS